MFKIILDKILSIFIFIFLFCFSFFYHFFCYLITTFIILIFIKSGSHSTIMKR